MRGIKLPTRDSYEDALVAAAVVLVMTCLIFMGVALVLGSWGALLWSILTLLGSITIVFFVAIIIENNDKKKSDTGA